MCVKNIANRTSFDKMNLGPTKNMSKQPFLKKNEQIMNVFEDYESTKHAVIWYKRSQII